MFKKLSARARNRDGRTPVGAGRTVANLRRPLRAGAGAALLLVSSVYAAPASAQDVEAEPAAVEAALSAVGALSPQGHAQGVDGGESDVAEPAGLSPEGITIESSSGTFRMAPISNGDATPLSSGAIMFGHTSDSAFVITSSDHGANAGYSVLLGPDAPSEYSYELYVNGVPASLERTEGGGIAVLDSAGDVVNLLAPAWAKDATGSEVPTEYRINGNTVTQVVHHGGSAAYPVVADPRLQCDGLWCTVELTRAETAAVADNALNAGILCTFIPAGGAAACAAVVIGAWAHANIARANGLCTGYRVWQANLVSFAHLAYVSCYA